MTAGGKPYLAVRNWQRFQHYRSRTPDWIKLHLELLHDEKLKALPIPTRLLFDQMLLLAGTFQNAVPNSPEVISTLTGIAPEACREGIDQLLQGRWLSEKQTRRSTSKPARTEKSREEEIREETAEASPEEPKAPNLALIKSICPECECQFPNHQAECSQRATG